ncbi:MAG: L-fuconolactonase [Candidatus Azotimanducaceae bacterium]|jgi:L-fuconolactonase
MAKALISLFVSIDSDLINRKDKNLPRTSTPMNSTEHNKTQHSDWLLRVTEEILEPDRKICDPHHHLWDRGGSRYLLHELLADIESGHRVVSTVFVECDSMFNAEAHPDMAPIGETEFVQGVAAMSASGLYGDCRVAAGIVSFADLCLGSDVRAVLDAHIAASPNRFRGIRHATSWHSSPDIRNSHSKPTEHLMLDETFNRGMAVLGEMGLSFDAWCYHTQISEFATLAKQHPEVTMVLDHFGGPLGVGPYEGKSDEVFAAWRESVESLVDAPNVAFKLGGINMKINGFGWHKRDLPASSNELVDSTAAYYETCIDLFGAERCMFESNFPVDRDSVSYPVLWNAFKKIATGRSEQEKSALFHDTAARVYKLNADVTSRELTIS